MLYSRQGNFFRCNFFVFFLLILPSPGKIYLLPFFSNSLEEDMAGAAELSSGVAMEEIDCPEMTQVTLYRCLLIKAGQKRRDLIF